MNVTVRRLGSVVVAAALGAALAVTARGPALSAPPEGKSKPDPTAFAVRADLMAFWEYSMDIWEGDFRASGAIADRGDARLFVRCGDEDPLFLHGKQGDIEIIIDPDNTFYVVGGTRAYEKLEAVGSVRWGKVREGPHGVFRQTVTLEGTVLSQ